MLALGPDRQMAFPRPRCREHWGLSSSLVRFVCAVANIWWEVEKPSAQSQAWSTVASGSTPLGRGVGASLHPSSSAANAPYWEGSVN